MNREQSRYQVQQVLNPALESFTDPNPMMEDELFIDPSDDEYYDESDDYSIEDPYDTSPIAALMNTGDADAYELEAETGEPSPNKVGTIYSKRLNRQVEVFAKKGERPADAIKRVAARHR